MMMIRMPPIADILHIL